VAAVLPGDRVLWFCLPAEAGARVRPSAPLALAAMGASGTVRLRLDRLLVTEDAVLEVEELGAWRARDRIATAQPSPAVLGLAAACVARLAGPPSGSLGDELRRCRDHAYGLADGGGTDQAAVARLVDARAWSLDLGLRAARALVAATGGRALERGHPAQRLLREAAFHLIQAQTAAGRAASLARVAAESARAGPDP
jgi:hypothetical protein